MRSIENLNQKTEPLLRQILINARQDEILRIIIVLDPSQIPETERDISPAQFQSRREYRQFLIQERASQLSQNETIATLKQLLPKVHGGKLISSIVAEGTANKIRASLELPGVQHAIFDRKIGPPVSDEIIQRLARAYEEILPTNPPPDQNIVFAAMQQFARKLLQQRSMRFEPPVTIPMYLQPERRTLPERSVSAAVSVETLLGEKKNPIIWGASGAGKTTLLHKIASDTLHQNIPGIPQTLFPIFVQLSAQNHDLAKIATQEFSISGFPDPDKFTQLALEQGRLLFLCDNLSELPSKESSNLLEKILGFMKKYPANRFIVAGRNSITDLNMRPFHEMRLCPFSLEQTDRFIETWFASKQRTDFIPLSEVLRKPEFSELAVLARKPLFLFLFCLVYEARLSEDFMPLNRSALLQMALDAFLRQWKSGLIPPDSKPFRGLPVELEPVLLAEIAYLGVTAGRNSYEREELETICKEFLADRFGNEQATPSGILNILELKGVLQETESKTYTFPHLLWQEFLAAHYIYQKDLIASLLRDHLHDARYREVFLFLSGLLPSSDDFLEGIELEIAHLPVSENFAHLLSWTQEMIVCSSAPAKRICAQVFALDSYLLLHAMSFDAPHFQSAGIPVLRDSLLVRTSVALWEIIPELVGVRDMESFWRTENNLFSDQFKSFYRELQNMRDHRQRMSVKEWNSKKSRLYALANLAEDQSLRSETSSHALLLYLRSVKLLFDCKHAAKNVSRKAWETIEARLLLPPSKT